MTTIKPIRETIITTGAGGGSLFSAFCPACVPVIGSFLTAIGLGGLVNFTLLSWITIGFLILGVMGLFLNFRQHKKIYFLLIGILGSIGVYGGRYLTDSLPLIIVSSIIVIGNVAFDYRAIKKCKKCEVKNEK